MEGSRISSIGAALADPSRAAMLAALGSGRAHTAGELARWAGIAASTTSRHLSHLVDAGLITVTPSGRFRYYQIASEDVAEILERIDSIDLPETTPPRRPRPGTELSYARSCYDHLAGELGVRLYAALESDGVLTETDSGVVVGPDGVDALGAIGIDLAALSAQRRPLARACLDWTERRHHLGGSLGAAILDQMLTKRWLRRGKDRRVLKLTPTGAQSLPDRFHVDLS